MCIIHQLCHPHCSQKRVGSDMSYNHSDLKQMVETRIAIFSVQKIWGYSRVLSTL